MNRKIIFASAVGTTIEWAEFCFYGYLITLFSPLFFPMLNHSLGLIAGFGTFAVSYFARPIGGFIFGHMGDRWGRRKAFAGSILLMSVATLGIGLLPTYNHIGILAPILLITFRFFQGLGVAGEYPGASVFIIEHHRTQPYIAASWIATSAALGMLIGGFASMIISLPSMPQWAWRVPFCLSFVACFLGFYIRRHLSETGQYLQLLEKKEVEHQPIKTVFANYKRPLFQTAAIAAFTAIFVYICNVWWVTFVIEKHYFNAFEARALATISMCFVTIFTIVMGIVAQRWNGKKLMILGLLGDLIMVPVLFGVSSQQSFFLNFLVCIFYGLFQGAFAAPMLKFCADIFPTAVRYSGQSIGWNVSVAIFGATAPLVAQTLSTHNLLYVIIAYVILSGLVALVMIRTNRPQLNATEGVFTS